MKHSTANALLSYAFECCTGGGHTCCEFSSICCFDGGVSAMLNALPLGASKFESGKLHRADSKWTSGNELIDCSLPKM